MLGVWILYGWLGASAAARADGVPDPFPFAPLEGVARGSIQLSEPISIAGTDDPATISISAEYYSIKRTDEHFGTTPLASVSDARRGAALGAGASQHTGYRSGKGRGRRQFGGRTSRAVERDPPASPPGSDPASAPLSQPAAIMLINAVTDTSVPTGYTPIGFGIHASALNPHTQLAQPMPPTIAFHGDADATVPVTHSSRLCELMQAAGKVCEFVNVVGGTHGYRAQAGLSSDWKVTTNTMIEQLFARAAAAPLKCFFTHELPI